MRLNASPDTLVRRAGQQDWHTFDSFLGFDFLSNEHTRGVRQFERPESSITGERESGQMGNLSRSASRLPQSSPVSTKSSRYPNLEKYLRIYIFLTRVSFLLGLIGPNVLVAILTRNSGGAEFVRIAESDSKWILILILSEVMLVGLSCLFYVMNMAVIEFVKVFIDIEFNIRQLNVSPSMKGG